MNATNNNNSSTNKTEFNFREVSEKWHLKTTAEKNSALRQMSENQRRAIKFQERLAQLDWEEYQNEMCEQGF